MYRVHLKNGKKFVLGKTLGQIDKMQFESPLHTIEAIEDWTPSRVFEEVLIQAKRERLAEFAELCLREFYTDGSEMNLDGDVGGADFVETFALNAQACDLIPDERGILPNVE
jgi:hypothetical protein